MNQSQKKLSTETTAEPGPINRQPKEPEVAPTEKPDIVKEEHPLVPRLKAAIGCPVDWNKIAPQFPYIRKDLRIIWAQTAINFECDGETRFYSRQDVDDALDEAELQRIEINAKNWRPHAVKAYMERVGFLTKLTFATGGEQSKHYPNPAWSKAKIISYTAKHPALFYQETTLFYLRALLWTAIVDQLLDVIDKRPSHLYVRANDEIGASKGQTTRFLRIDVDYSKPLAHGHPILASELPAGIKLISETEGGPETFHEDVYLEFNNDIDEPRNPGYWELLSAEKKGLKFIPHND